MLEAEVGLGWRKGKFHDKRNRVFAPVVLFEKEKVASQNGDEY